MPGLSNGWTYTSASTPPLPDDFIFFANHAMRANSDAVGNILCVECKKKIPLSKSHTTVVKGDLRRVCREHEYKKCDKCGYYHKELETLSEDSPIKICAECIKSGTFKCRICGKRHLSSSLYRTISEEPMCKVCYFSKTKKCYNCGHLDETQKMTYYANINEYRCENCKASKEKNDAQGVLVYGTGTVAALRRKNLAVKSEEFPIMRHVGVEIEVERTRQATSENDRAIVASSSELGCQIKSDGSLTNGLEYVTRPAQGKDLEILLRSATRALQANNVHITSHCGLHIHISTEGWSQEDLKHLTRFYITMEDLIFDMLPYSRRSNTYCTQLSKFNLMSKLVKNVHLDKVIYTDCTLDKDEDYLDVASSLREYKRGHSGRNHHYWALNLHSHFYRGTLEFRMHSGSMNYIKMRNWINIVLRLCNHGVNIDEATLTSLYQKDKSVRRDYLRGMVLTEELASYYDKRVKKFSNNSQGDDEDYLPVSLTEQELNNLF